MSGLIAAVAIAMSGCVMTGRARGGSEGVLPRVIKESTCARADYATLRATAHLTFCKNERCHHACECKLSMHHGDSWRCKCIVKFRSRQKNEATPQQSCVTDCVVRIAHFHVKLQVQRLRLTTTTMVARHPKKGFKTTVSIVSSNVLQKVVTIKNSCSHSATPPPPPPPPPPKVPSEVRLHGNNTIREDLCCGPPLPLTILVNDDDTASEISCELYDDLEDRPLTPRPKTERKTLRTFCFAESSHTTCGLPGIPMNSMDWPSDEEPDDDESNHSSSALPFAASQYLPSPNFDMHSVCGQFWSMNTQPHTAPNSWGLLITDRDDHHEIRADTSSRDDGLKSTSSTYEYREPLAKLNESPFSTF